jgi:hypothetical protein
MIWALDTALNAAENNGETDLEAVEAPILRSHRRSAPVAAQNRKHDPSQWPKTPLYYPPTKTPRTAQKQPDLIPLRCLLFMRQQG